jgi:hypothetical protein
VGYTGPIRTGGLKSPPAEPRAGGRRTYDGVLLGARRDCLWHCCHHLCNMRPSARCLATWLVLKSEAVPQHTYGGARGERMYKFLLVHDIGTRWEWVVSVTPQPRFTPGERTPSSQWTGGWVSLRARMDTEARGKIFCLCRDRTSIAPLSCPTPASLCFLL